MSDRRCVKDTEFRFLCSCSTCCRDAAGAWRGHPLQRAIDEYRSAHPEVDDLPDEAIGNLMVVQQRAFGLALIAHGRALGEAWAMQVRRFLPRED